LEISFNTHCSILSAVPKPKRQNAIVGRDAFAERLNQKPTTAKKQKSNTYEQQRKIEEYDAFQSY
jgi:hypothetical protein